MAKNSFIVYYNYKEALADLTDEQVGKLFRALFEYEMEGKDPEFEGELKIAFRFIKKDLDINLTKYASVCERNRENGMKGGRPRNPENPKNPSGFSKTQENPKNPVGADDDNDIIYTSNNNIEKIKENSAISTIKEKKKETTQKFGEYAHVLLTDKQYEKLVEDYGQEKTSLAIKYLDEYIEMKGAVYKNYNLVLRKWVFDAVEKEEQKKGNDMMTHKYSKKELNQLFDNFDNIE